MKTLATIALCGFVGIVCAVMISVGMNKQAKVDCEELQKQAESGLVDFFISPSQKEECDEVKITVDAPVRIGR